MNDSNETLRILDELRAEKSLKAFIKLLWPVLEPGRPFTDGWVVDAICEHLEAITTGKIRRLLINIPPATMKSTALIFWPAWEWGPQNRPSMRYVCASYSKDLTIRDNRRCMILVESDVYKRAWGDRVQMSTNQAAKVKFENTAHGFRMATSVGGVGTGARGDRFIVDDPHNVFNVESTAKRDASLKWFSEVVQTRLNDMDTSAIVVIMQRSHEHDISGHILAKEMGYEHLCLPMEFEPERRCRTSIGFQDPRTEPGELLWPARFSAKVVEDLKRDMSSWGGTYAVSGQLQQRPTPRGGGMFQRKDFQFIPVIPPGLYRFVRGWDLAATRDGHGAYTVGVKLGIGSDKRLVVADVVRLRGSPGEVRAAIRRAAEADGHAVEQSLPQDPGQSGKAQVQDLAGVLAGYVCHFSPESGSKEDRARPLAAQVEAGMVDLVTAPWNDAFVAELAAFPMSEQKDQVDAASRAYARLTSRREPMRPGIAPEVF